MPIKLSLILDSTQRLFLLDAALGPRMRGERKRYNASIVVVTKTTRGRTGNNLRKPVSVIQLFRMNNYIYLHWTSRTTVSVTVTRPWRYQTPTPDVCRLHTRSHTARCGPQCCGPCRCCCCHGVVSDTLFPAMVACMGC
jgi:hypothetical protein